MKKSRFFSFVLSVALALAASQSMARIGDPPKKDTAPKSAPAKKAESPSKGSFGMASSGGNSRTDLAAQVKAREAAQKQAQQDAARKTQEDAARAQAARQQQQLLAQQQAAQARLQQQQAEAARAQAAEQARLAALRAPQVSQLNAQREAQRLADQNEAQARLIRQQQRALDAQQDALRYRNNSSYGGYVSAEEAARRARNGTLAGAAGGAAVGGVVGYEMGKHNSDGTIQSQQGQVYQQAPVAPSVVPTQTAPYVAPVTASQEKSSGFGTVLVVLLLIAGLGGVVFFFISRNKNSAPSKVDSNFKPSIQPTPDAPAVSVAPAQTFDNRPAQNAELIQDITEFFGKLQAYYNTKNAEALTALTSSQMLSSIKEAFVTGGHVVTEFSNVYISLEEVKDTEVSALIEADAREIVDGEVSNYRLREIWTMKRETFGLVLDGITRLD